MVKREVRERCVTVVCVFDGGTLSAPRDNPEPHQRQTSASREVSGAAVSLQQLLSQHGPPSAPQR